MAPLTAGIVWYQGSRAESGPAQFREMARLAGVDILPLPDGATQIVPQDAIVSIQTPQFVSVSAAQIPPDEPMILLRRGSSTRAYSTALLNAHEIVNDELEGEPLAVTW